MPLHLTSASLKRFQKAMLGGGSESLWENILTGNSSAWAHGNKSRRFSQHFFTRFRLFDVFALTPFLWCTPLARPPSPSRPCASLAKEKKKKTFQAHLVMFRLNHSPGFCSRTLKDPTSARNSAFMPRAASLWSQIKAVQVIFFNNRCNLQRLCGFMCECSWMPSPSGEKRRHARLIFF